MSISGEKANVHLICTSHSHCDIHSLPSCFTETVIRTFSSVLQEGKGDLESFILSESLLRHYLKEKELACLLGD